MTAALKVRPADVSTGSDFTLTHGALSRALTIVDACIPDKRFPVPILGGIKLTSSETSVSLQAFDYEVSVTIGIPVEFGAQPGETLLNCSTVSKFVRSMNVGTSRIRNADIPIRVEQIGSSRSQITSAGYALELPGMPVEDYPSLPKFENVTTSFAVDRDELARSVERTALAAGKDDTLPMLTGVRFELDAESQTVTLASTDRFRLAVSKFAARVDGTSSALVPARNIAHIIRVLPEGDVVVSFADGLVWFTASNVSVSVRLLDIEFVKYRSLLPDANTTAFAVKRSIFLEAVARTTAVCGKRQHVHLVYNDGGIQLTAGGLDDGRAVSPNLAVEVIAEAPLSMAFQFQYLLDMLRASKSEMVYVGATNPNHPAMFSDSPGGLTGEAGHRHLVMPARLPS